MALRSRRGVWQFVKTINGTLYRRSTGFPVANKTTKAAATRRASEIETEIRSGAHGWTRDMPTIAAYWTKTYRPTYTLGKRAPKRDDQVMAHALPVFGTMRLDEVKKSDCERYLNMRRVAPHANPGRRQPGQMAEGSVQRERSFLHAFFQQAIEDGVIDKNPWRKIERVAYAVRDRLLSHEEQPILLARLSPRFQRFVLFLLGTGIRLDECRGINPAKDLHLVERWVPGNRQGWQGSRRADSCRASARARGTARGTAVGS